MGQDISVNVMKFMIAVSDALDFISPLLAKHQLRTAYISWKIAEKLNFSRKQTDELVYSALLHDIGALTPENKIYIHESDCTNLEDHCTLGEKIAKKVGIFSNVSEIIRYHHSIFDDTKIYDSSPVLQSARIINIADSLERHIQRGRFILFQDKELKEKIKDEKKEIMTGEIEDVLDELLGNEAFWLTLVYPRIENYMLGYYPSANETIDKNTLIEMSELIRSIIDFRSHFTATHTAGVAECAMQLAGYMKMSNKKIDYLRIAGNLHDLGKLAVPNDILEKDGKLSRDEYSIIKQHTYYTYTILKQSDFPEEIAETAAFHHEKLNGKGYPFHRSSIDLSQEARLMAVADIYTAISEDRPYRDGMGKDDIIRIMTDMAGRNEIDKDILGVLIDNFDDIKNSVAVEQEKANENYMKLIYLK